MLKQTGNMEEDGSKGAVHLSSASVTPRVAYRPTDVTEAPGFLEPCFPLESGWMMLPFPCRLCPHTALHTPLLGVGVLKEPYAL